MTTITRQDLINKGLIKPSANPQPRRAMPDIRAAQARRRESRVITPTDKAMAILNAALERASNPRS